MCWESRRRGYELLACARMRGRRSLHAPGHALPNPGQAICLALPSWHLAQEDTVLSTSQKGGGGIGPAHCLGPLRPLLLDAQLMACEVTEQEGERT